MTPVSIGGPVFILDLACGKIPHRPRAVDQEKSVDPMHQALDVEGVELGRQGVRELCGGHSGVGCESQAGDAPMIASVVIYLGISLATLGIAFRLFDRGQTMPKSNYGLWLMLGGVFVVL